MPGPKVRNIVTEEQPLFAIFAALDEEFEALRAYISLLEHLQTPIPHWRCHLANGRGDLIPGVIYQAHRKGRTEAAISTALMLSKYAPRHVCAVGIAGAIRLDHTQYIGLGDVVFATEIRDYELAKEWDDRTEPREHITQTRPEVVQAFAAFLSSGSWQISRQKWLTRISPLNPQVLCGPVLSGNRVIARSRARHELWHISLTPDGASKSPLAVEMESVGVAMAVERVSPLSEFCLLKGVSDFADSNKAVDEAVWRAAACDNAAFVATEFLRQHLL